MPEKEKFFQDLLEEIDDDLEEDNQEESQEQEKEKTEEEKLEEERRKNKDAEEARKRREAEAKAKAEEEARLKAEEEAKKQNESKRQKTEKDLGDQLVDFKKKYPDADLATLDKDTHFKRYIDGKLLGKKDFTALYEEYLDMRSSLSGKTAEEIRTNYERKAQSSSGSSTSAGGTKPNVDVYSEEELRKISERLPFMSRQEAAKIDEKLNRSINYYKK